MQKKFAICFSFFSLWLQSFQNAITRFCCAISGRGLEIQAVDLFKSPVLGQLFDSNLNWKMQLNFEFWTRVSFVQFATNLNSGKKTTLLQIFITSEDKSRKLHFKSTFKLDFFAPTLQLVIHSQFCFLGIFYWCV